MYSKIRFILWPEVGLINQTRSNYRFGIVQQSVYYSMGRIMARQFKIINIF